MTFLLLPHQVFAAQLTNQFSISIWVNPTTSIASKALVVKDTEVRLVTDASGNPSCAIYASAAWQTAATSSQALTLGAWTHVTCTYDKATIKVFVNGVQTGSVAQTNALNDAATSLLVGQDDTATYGNFIGITDQLQIYNYARTAGQIIEDMNAGHPAPGSPVGTPLGYWKFEQGADNTCSGGSNDACNSGSQGSTLDGAESGMAVPATSTSGWTQSGKFGKALVFDGSNDYVTAADNNALSPSSALTLSAWIYPTTISSNTPVVFSKQTSAGGVGDYYLNISNTGGRFYINGTLLTYTYTFATSTWYHLSAVYDASNTSMKVYVNGIQVASTSSAPSSMTNTSAALYIGTDPNSITSTYTFAGTIDEPKIYGQALTADQVKIDMNRGASQVLGALSDNSTYQPQAANQEYCVPGDATACTAPVARYDFEEGTGTTANDVSGNANTGTINGATYGRGKNSKGLSFDGTNDIVDVANESTFDFTSSFTIEAWIKPTGSDTYNGIVGKYVGTATGWDFILTNGKSRMSVRGTSSIDNSGVGSDLRDNNWHHVVAVVNGTSSITTYTDGKFIDTTTGTWTAVTNDGGVTIGGRYIASDLPFRGQIDQVRIFNYARSAAQVAWDYNKGGPVGHWKLDECQGTVANDSSGNSNTGTITIGATGTQTTAGTCAGSANEAWKDGVTGKRNYSLDFDGTDDYINMGQVLPTSVTTPFTFAAWVNPASGGASTWRTIIGTHTSFAEITISSGNLFSCGQNAGGGFFNQDSTTTITNGTWYFISCTYDGTNLSLYTNGILTSGPTARTFTNASHGVSLLGRFGTASGEWMNGQIDDARVYNYALTPTQVKTLYTGGALNFAPVTGAP